jgi:probable HAF family extracellular repeat protein
MRRGLLWIFSIAFALSSASAQTPLYNIVDLGDLGWFTSGASGINLAGNVTGSASVYNPQENTGYSHAFVYSGQKMIDVGTLPLGTITWSGGNSINSAGQVAGASSGVANGNTVQHAFLYSPSQGMQDLGALLKPSLTSAATAVNSLGEVVGYAFDGTNYSSWLYDGSMHPLAAATSTGLATNQAVAINANGQVLIHLWPKQGGSLCYLWAGGTMTQLPVKPACAPAFLSDQGWATGDLYNNGAAAHAFAYKLGTQGPTDLGTLAPGNPAADSHGYSVNDSGAVAGSSLATDGTYHAFVYTSGAMMDLNALIPQGTPWATLTTATGINGSGQITGSGSVHTQGGTGPCVPGGDCVTHAFRLDPM